MPFVFRAISRAKWYPSESISWLDKDDLQADSLLNLRTSDNELSFYIIEDNGSNLQRVLIAFAATRERLSNLDYTLIDQNMLKSKGFRFKSTSGETPDKVVNGWHNDMFEISVRKLVVLVDEIRAKPEQTKRESHKNLKRWMVESISAGHLDRNQMNAKLLEDIGI